MTLSMQNESFAPECKASVEEGVDRQGYTAGTSFIYMKKDLKDSAYA